MRNLEDSVGNTPRPCGVAPGDMLRDIALLPKAARDDFNWWRDRIEPLLSMKHGVMAAIEEVARRSQVPVKTVQNRYYAAKRQGLRGLIDKRLAGPRWWKVQQGHGELPLEDRELVKLYCERNGRSNRSAVKELRRDWRHGKVRTSRAVDPKTGYPFGWSIENLCRYAPTKFELKAARIGRAAAAAHRPLVYTTRKDLWVGSHYMLDDMWHDFFVNSFAEKQAGRPLELFSHDLFSARKVRWGFRIRTRKDDGTYNQLTEAMTRQILAATLYCDGYSPRGTVIVAEHGTAAVREAIERALLEISDGLITVSRSGMEGAAAHAGQYPGIARGNFRHKASLESSNNLTHNVFAAIPAQTGPDKERRPEQLDAMLRNNEQLLIAYDKLSPARRELLQFPVLEATQFHAVAQELYAAIETDPVHELEGWIECGHVVQELFLGGQWTNQALLLQGEPHEQELALSLIASGKLQTRPRRMTRREVWDLGAGELIKLPGHGVVAILGDDFARARKVRHGMFEFEDAAVGPGAFRFDAVAFDPWGQRVRLVEGESYECFINPFTPWTLFVRKADGTFIGECRVVNGGVPCRADIENVMRACGAAAKTEAELLAPMRQRHMAEARAKAARHQNNSAVLRGAPITPEEKSAAEAQRDLAAELTDAERAAATEHPQLSDDSPHQFSPEEISNLFSE